MCGIFGAFRREGAFSETERAGFASACDVIAHRGPDADGNFSTHTSDASSTHPNLYLGHRRLAILDLDQASNQPFVRDGLVMVYNGEVFNYKELRETLTAHYQFDTQSDTEVILRAYQHYGAACFGKFNGMWAIAIYDPAKGKLILSRDRFSIKPFYLMRSADALYFASEIKQFKKLHGVSLSPNIATVGRFLNQGLIDDSGQTFYKEITHLPSMHFMEIDLHTGDEVCKKYWNFSEKAPSHEPGGHKAQFKSLLIDSLKLRLRSDVPLGTMLSGGLDSSAITALVAKYINPDITSFSVVADERSHSEEDFVDILVQKNGIKNQKLRFDTSMAVDHVDEVLSVQDGPYGSLSVVAQYLLFKKIKEETDITVLLSGQGADEVLLGYNKFFYFYLRQLLAQKRPGKMAATALASFFKGTTLRQFDLTQAKRYLPGRTNSGRTYFKTRFDDESLWAADDMRRRQILDIEKYSVPALAHYEDRNAMASSLEVRLPFLDFRLVDFLVNLPVEEKLKGGWSKYILRDAIDEMPEEIRWRRDKKGFVTPEETWMKGPFGAYIIDYMQSHHALSDLGILDNAAFVDAVKGFRNGAKWLSTGDIFRVFITEKWLNEA